MRCNATHKWSGQVKGLALLFQCVFVLRFVNDLGAGMVGFVIDRDSVPNLFSGKQSAVVIFSFCGMNGSKQPYRLLLPGVWVSLQASRSMFSPQLNPFAVSVFSNKPYLIRNVINGSDLVIEKRTLNKVFGISAGAGFDYNVKNKWWLDGKLAANFWRNGTTTIKGEKTNTMVGGTTLIYVNTGRIDDNLWDDFQKI